ncbi:MAG: hypothetical protein ING03_15160 [Roseomonas sp.]|nr:hypothetical protein [Roseomonas sp.]
MSNGKRVASQCRRPTTRVPAEKLVRDIRRAMRKHHSAEGNIRIVMEDLGSEELIENIQKLGPESFALSVPFATPLHSPPIGLKSFDDGQSEWLHSGEHVRR